MARQLLRDTSDVARQIMDGEVDEHLDTILQAVQARKHNLYRPGARVRFKDTRDPSLEGREGVIIKVLAKRIQVGIGEQDKFGFEREINFPPQMLEIIQEGGE